MVSLEWACRCRLHDGPDRSYMAVEKALYSAGTQLDVQAVVEAAEKSLDHLRMIWIGKCPFLDSRMKESETAP